MEKTWQTRIVTQSQYRDLPAVDQLASHITSPLPRALAIDVARLAIEQARADIASGEPTDVFETASRLGRAVHRSATTRVINATGVLLHTNLGRAVWSDRAAARAMAAASGFSNIEMDLEAGARGRRGEYVNRLLCQLTDAEDALVVNNNASALLLALAATSRDRSVPVSRGEMIEIGGAYRLPTVMAASGSSLVEIGTTNRTRLGDYVTALQTYDCGAILKVHPSNYRVEGFTEEATLADLARLKTETTPLLYDIGSGLLDAGAGWVPPWLEEEPAARQSLAAGADLVLFSGDKLLGGPQAGIIAGRGDLVTKLRANPLTRALRVDGVVYAALEATLESYLANEPTAIPFWRHALLPIEALTSRADNLAGQIGGLVDQGSSAVGAGSAPGARIPSPVVRLADADHLFLKLVGLDQPIITRRDHGDLVIDLRAVEPEEDESVIAAIDTCR